MAGITGMRRLTDWAWRSSIHSISERSQPNFAYGEKLDQHSVRLLKLPDTGGSALDFTIETFVLDQLPDYIALSYTWGPAQAPTPASSSQELTLSPSSTSSIPHHYDTINLNSHTFNVLPNLHTALQYIVDARPNQYLWVDSICINQGDLDERAAQVGIMDTVYSAAHETIIWLGQENEHTSSSLHTIRQMASGAEGKIIEYARRQKLGDVFVTDDKELLMKNGLPPMTGDDWLHLEDLYSRTWFSRVWMIQEVALSPNPTCMIGGQTIAWDSIGYAALLLGASNALVGLYAVGQKIQYAPLVMGITQAINLQTMREWCRGVNSPLHEAYATTDFSASIPRSIPEAGLLKLLLSSNGYQATVRRDRIYALLGILNHLWRQQGNPPLTLTVDYTSPEDSVLSSLALRLLRETESLHMLSLAGEGSRTGTTSPSLPTWIPSFENVSSPIIGPFAQNLKPFKLPGESDDDPVFYIDEPRLRLHVQVMSPNLGSIEELGETWQEMTAGSFTSCMRMLLHCGSHYTFTKQPIVEAFWRCLIMDNDMAQSPAPRRLANAFRDWFFLITLNALIAGRDENPNLFDLFDTLEGLFILANTRDETGLLPKSAAMVEQAALFGIYSDPGNPMLPQPARERILRNKGRSAAPYEGMLKVTLPSGRRLARTVRGYLCLVPLKAEVGDKVMVIRGCPTPLVLRRVKDEMDCYKIIGDVYVHGAMFGEHVTADSVWRNIILA
ncbi:heterokaryon incompatibility protein (HET) domain-containing protein [Sarocladium implicatum]|nr:heterokaryon incompatibility protein (HET) domain-containing protein [Sarocladium implicatum]